MQLAKKTSDCGLLWCALAGAVLVASTGCGGKYDAQVSGQVTLDGKPLEQGMVAYCPKHGGPIAYSAIDKDGQYTLSTGREAGIKPGDYDVTVVANETSVRRPNDTGPPPPGRRLTAEHISDKQTTDLHYTVEPGDNTIDLKLYSP